MEFKGSPSVSGLGAVQVGNNLLILLSLIFSHLRLDANHYLQMDNSEAAEIFKQSGCSKPCAYSTRGTILSGRNRLPPFSTNHFLFSLWALGSLKQHPGGIRATDLDIIAVSAFADIFIVLTNTDRQQDQITILIL